MPKNLPSYSLISLIYVVWGPLTTYRGGFTRLSDFPSQCIALLYGRIDTACDMCMSWRTGLYPKACRQVGCERNHPAVHRYGGSDAGPAICQQQPGGCGGLLYRYLDYGTRCSDVEIYLSEQMYPCRYFDGICRSRVIVCRATEMTVTVHDHSGNMVFYYL